jgi:hypothetical protein
LLGALAAALLLAGCFSTEGSDAPRPYEECSVITDTCSAASDGCYRISNGQVQRAMCTSECDVDDDCDEGVCARNSGDVHGTRLCFHRCEVDADCLSGFSCQMTDHTQGPICMPVAR